jgi:hypothetical protein
VSETVTAPASHRGRANMARVRQSMPESGLGPQVKVLKKIEFFPPPQNDLSCSLLLKTF